MKLLLLFFTLSLHSSENKEIPRSQPIPIPKVNKYLNKVIKRNKKFLKRYKIFKQLREKARQEKTK